MENNEGTRNADLVKRIREGDESAFAEVYERSSHNVFMTCKSVLGNEADAEDAMQETYITVFNSIASLSDDRTLYGWIMKIAANKSLDAVRKRRNNLSYEDAIATEEDLEGNDDLESLPESLIIEETKREEFHKIIKRELSDVQYQTILFHYFNDMGIDEIASAMDCPEGTVKTRLKSARIKIRSAVEKYETETGDKLAAYAVVPFLARFFREESKGLKVPEFKTIAKSFGNSSSATGKGGHSSSGKQGKLSSGKSGSAALKAGKAGFLSTTGGKIVAGVVALAVLVPAIVVVTNVINKPKNDDEDEDERIVETEISASETTVPSEAVHGMEEVDPDDLPGAIELGGLINCWNVRNYDCEDIPDNFVLDSMFPLTRGSAVVVDLSFCYEGYCHVNGTSWTGNVITTEEHSLWENRIPVEELLWAEENVYNISPEDIERINRVATSSDEPGSPFIEDGYFYFYCDLEDQIYYNHTINDAHYDGKYYYITVEYVDFEDTNINDSATEYIPHDIHTIDFVLEYKTIDDKNVWSVISCKGPEAPAAPTAMPAETTAPTGEEPAALISPYEAPDTGWKTAYKNVVESIAASDFDYVNERGTTYNTESGRREYDFLCDLVFINDDLIPELEVTITDSAYHLTSYTRIYTYQNGEAVFLEEFLQDTGYGYDALYVPRENWMLVNGTDTMDGPASYSIAQMTENMTDIEVNYDAYESWCLVDSETGWPVYDEEVRDSVYGFDRYDFEVLVGGFSKEEFISRLGI